MENTIDMTLSLQEVCGQNKTLREIIDLCKIAISMKEKNPSLLQPVASLKKQVTDFIEYQYMRPGISRDISQDRVFPLDTVTIREFATDHEKNLENATIHTGPAADEFVRSLNALAVTIAGDIYFRNGAYRPETEEGRMLLAHELTHVSQFEGKRITTAESTAELEQEATNAEAAAVYDDDPVLSFPVGTETVRVRTSQLPKLTHLVANDIEEWITSKKHSVPEQEYLELLSTFTQWLEEAL